MATSNSSAQLQLSSSRFQGVKILNELQFANKIVYFVWNENEKSLEVFIHSKGILSNIPISEIDFLNNVPTEYLNNPKKIQELLLRCSVTVSRYLDKENMFKINISPTLKGGGNIQPNARLWPLSADNKFNIPYKINIAVSPTAQRLLDAKNIAELKKIEMEMIKAGLQDSLLQAQQELQEKKAVENNIQRAVAKWNATGLINIHPVEGMTMPSSNHITFTLNANGVCHVSCIGMCAGNTALNLTCDLKGSFKDQPVRHIMHEIGHAVGLRHEHVNTNGIGKISLSSSSPSYKLESQDGLAITSHDFDSIMHYPLAKYPNGLVIELDPAYIKTLEDTYGTYKSYNKIMNLYHTVGRQEEISANDRQAVQYLINEALKVKKKEEEKAAAEQRVRDASTTSALSFEYSQFLKMLPHPSDGNRYSRGPHPPGGHFSSVTRVHAQSSWENLPGNYYISTGTDGNDELGYATEVENKRNTLIAARSEGASRGFVDSRRAASSSPLSAGNSLAALPFLPHYQARTLSTSSDYSLSSPSSTRSIASIGSNPSSARSTSTSPLSATSSPASHTSTRASVHEASVTARTPTSSRSEEDFGRISRNFDATPTLSGSRGGRSSRRK